MSNSSVTIGNTSVALGSTATTVGNVTLTNATVSSLATALPNNLLANSSVTIGNTAVALGSTVTSFGNVTLTNATISSVSTPITAAQGGTGLTSITANNVMLGNGTSAVQIVAPGTSGNVLTSTGTTWVSQVASGGSGTVNSGTAYQLAYYASTGTAVSTLGSLGTSGQVLTSGGAGVAPSWTTISGGATQATPTALGTVYGAMDTGSYGQAFIGYQAGNGNTTSAANNTAMGNAALYTNTGAGHNSAFGFKALYFTATGGDSNSAFGSAALYSNTTGTNNVAIGRQALYSNTTTNNNVAIGYQALYTAPTLAGNVAIGVGAMYGGGAGYAIGIGYSALNTGGGQYSIAIGYNALLNETSSGGPNLAFGYNAGSTITSGSNNMYFGVGSAASSATVTNEICISNTAGARTGKGGSTFYVNANGGNSYNGANSATWAVTSDQRLKKNIVDNTVGLESINAIRVRNFEYRLPEEITELDTHCAILKEGVQLGVIAQELQSILPDCVKTESTGVLSVNSENITWHLINAVKELSAELNALKAKVGA